MYYIKTPELLTLADDVERWFDMYSDLIDATDVVLIYVVELGLVTLVGGAVDKLRSKKTAGGLELDAPDTKRPIYVADAGDGMPAMLFERYPAAAPDLLAITGFPAAAGASFTKFVQLKAPSYAGAVNSGELFSSDSAGNRHQLKLNNNINSGDYFNMLIGAAPNQVNMTWPNRPVDTWCLVENAWNGETHTAGLAVNGSAWMTSQATAAVPSGGDPACIADVTSCSIGALSTDGSNRGFFGHVRMFGATNRDLTDPANADRRSALHEFARILGVDL